MNPSVLLQKLIDIERSIGVETQSTTRRRVLEAQEYVLRVHLGADDSSRPRPIEHRAPEKFYLLRELAKAK